MNEMKVRRLNDTGIKEFVDYLAGGAEGPVPEDWLVSDAYSEELGYKWTLDADKKFADRYEFAQYAWSRLQKDWDFKFENDPGLWSWLALRYLKQFLPADGPNHQEHYIYNPHRYSSYRHCAATPIKLVRDFGQDARLFLTNDMTRMGDMLEQCMSRQYLVRSKTFRGVVRRLYYDDVAERLKPGASSKVVRKKAANGTWSKGGAGSVRRLALEILRLNLGFNLEAMTPDEVLGLLGKEYSRFKLKVPSVAKAVT